jgi:hypothetical protein
MGKIIAVSGSRATVGTAVSKIVLIESGNSQLIGVVTAISLNLPAVAKEQGYRAVAYMHLLRDTTIGDGGTARSGGVSEYLTWRAIAHDHSDVGLSL